MLRALVRGNVLAVGTSSTFPGIGASFPKVDLAVGESVTLSFDFRFTASSWRNHRGAAHHVGIEYFADWHLPF